MRYHNLLYWLAACALTFWTATSCQHEKNELVHDHEHEHGHEHEHEHGHEGHNHGDMEIELSPQQAQVMGVKTMTIEPGDFAESIEATARIEGSAAGNGTVSARKSGIFTYAKGIAVGSKVGKGQLIGRIDATGTTGGDADAAALANLNFAKKEMERLKPLYEKQLVTAERYNAAVAAYEEAKATYTPSSVSGSVVAPTAGVLTELLAGEGQYVNTGEEIARLSDGSSLTLTADVPDRYLSDIPSITNAVIVTSDNRTVDISDLGGRKLSSASSVSRNAGYVPVVFSFNNDNRFVPGSIIKVFLTGNSKKDVISVPVSAVTEQQGLYFVFVKLDDDEYVKTPVVIGQRNGKSLEIKSGLHKGDEIVYEGVTALRLAETSGAVPEGHSHSH